MYSTHGLEVDKCAAACAGADIVRPMPRRRTRADPQQRERPCCPARTTASRSLLYSGSKYSCTAAHFIHCPDASSYKYLQIEQSLTYWYCPAPTWATRATTPPERVGWALRVLARRRDGVEGCHERDLGAGWLR